MKTSVSIPDEIFKAADKLARQQHVSRSELYARALAEFVRAHGRERVLEELNKVYQDLAPHAGGDRAAQRRLAAAALAGDEGPREDWL